MGSISPTPLNKNSQANVTLIPWDFASPEHFERLVQQRIVCGWGHDQVEKWKAGQETGALNLQWVVSPHLHHLIQNPDFPRSSKPQTQKQRQEYSSTLVPTLRKKHFFLTPQPLSEENRALSPCHRGASSPWDISA